MSIADLIRRMAEEGASARVIAIAVEALEAEADARKRPARERKQRQRERERDQAVTVTGQERDGHDQTPPPPASSPGPPPPPTPTPGETTTRARALRRCPESWAPSAADLAVAAAEGFSPGEIERELAKFRDHTFSTPRSDWSATFRNWVRSDRQKPRQAHERPATDKFDRNQANLDRASAGVAILARSGAFGHEGD